MQSFAVASVSPRSIAWLIRLDEWERFEKIVKYNCAMVGGYFNIVIPLIDQDAISEEYRRLLIEYDPGLVVLAPGMKPNQLDSLSKYLHPFVMVPWDSISRIASLDPLSSGSGINTTMLSEWIKAHTEAKQLFIAIADNTYPDTSRLAFVACGDVEPRDPMWHVMDEDIDLDAMGYREHFLIQSLRSEADQNSVVAHTEDDMIIVPAPDRYQLSQLISEERQFPLKGATQILKACCTLQHFPLWIYSFIDLTASYKRIGGTPRRVGNKRPPAVVILVSDTFSLDEALLFWNLRASEVYVAWLPFSELESDLDAVVKWLESDYGGVFYSMSRGLEIAFSTSNSNIIRLQAIVNKLLTMRQEDLPHWKIVPRSELIFYDYVRPHIKQEHVPVVKDGSTCSFIPKLPEEDTSGTYAVTVEWKDLMLPQNSALVSNWRSLNSIEYFHFTTPRGRDAIIVPTVIMSHSRVTKNHYLRMQVSSEKPIEFDVPSPEHIVESLFSANGFSRIERSSAARYHRSFVDRAGSLEEATHYLARAPYRELLEVLSNNSNRNLTGWIRNSPSKRRVLHHLHLRELLGKPTLLTTVYNWLMHLFGEHFWEHLPSLFHSHAD